MRQIIKSLASPSFGGLPVLGWVDLSNNLVTNIPVELTNSRSLSTLILNNNLVTEIPTDIGNIASLRTLSLNQNFLTSVPDSIGNLTNIRTLGLSNNQLTALPSSFNNLYFDSLNLDNNLLSLGLSDLTPSGAGLGTGVASSDQLVGVSDEEMAFTGTFNEQPQPKPAFPYTVSLRSGKTLLAPQNYSLGHFEDESGNPVTLSDYVDANGTIIQAGRITARIRVSTTGTLAIHDPSLTVERVVLVLALPVVQRLL